MIQAAKEVYTDAFMNQDKSKDIQFAGKNQTDSDDDKQGA